MLKIKILTFGLTLLTSTIYAMFGQDCADKTAHLPIAEADTTPLNAIYINAMNRLVTDSALRFGQG